MAVSVHRGEQTLSTHESEQHKKATNEDISCKATQPDARLVAIVRLLARIAAERDYNSFIHRYEETNHD
jgi:hypothetical protein